MFHTAAKPVGRRAVAFYLDGSRGSLFSLVFTGPASDSFRVFGLNTFLCFPNHIMVVTKAPQDPN